MHKAIHIYTLGLASFLTIAVFASYGGLKEGTKEESSVEKNGGTVENKNLPQIIKPVDLDQPFDFAGEAVPMDNFDVRERLDRELLVNTYWHSTTILNIKGAYKYFPIMEKILAEEGVPEDFKYIAVAESSLRNATSHAGAKGVWQFMEAIGRAHNLEINGEVDERYHIEKASKAAAEYIKDQYRRFGTWTLAAAAYNMGGTRLARDLQSQRADDYYDLNLNEETSRYVFRVIAIKEILKDPQQFGFYLDKADGYSPLEDYDLVEVNGAIENLGDFAAQHGISYRMLKVYNPWLISTKLTNRERKTYQIKIPRKKF